MNLFEPIVSVNKYGEEFKKIIENLNTHELTVNQIEECYKEFIDKDNNFKEQFQTTGFNARLFELYLYTTFKKLGFSIKEKPNIPDFILSGNEVEVCIEATTIEESILSRYSEKDIAKMTPEELENYKQNELPIRFGGAVYTKFRKYIEDYSKLDACQNKPYVIAVEAFFNDDALYATSSPLSELLYGRHLSWEKIGDYVKLKEDIIQNHILENKNIPSGLFNMKEYENVSAIMFTNSATTSKFKRMGYQNNMSKRLVKLIRMGQIFDESDIKCRFVKIDIDNTDYIENWEDGITIFYNPNAKYPLEKGKFGRAVEYYDLESGNIPSGIPLFYNSRTGYFDLGVDIPEGLKNNNIRDTIRKLEKSGLEINRTSAFSEFKSLISYDEKTLFLLCYDELDKDYGVIAYRLNDLNKYEVLDIKVEFNTHLDAIEYIKTIK